MAAYELLLLNTAIPQIQAAQSGDTYLCPRELAVVVNSATDAVRITQTGAGNALLVEDSANPDSTPFVVTAAGDVGIGTSSPSYKLSVSKASAGDVAQFTNGGASNKSLFVYTDATYAAIATGNNASGNGIAFDAVNNQILFTTNSANQMWLDSSGNLGLGVTPSGWFSTIRALQIGSVGGAVITGNTSSGGSAILGLNVYFDAATAASRYGASSFASYYSQFNGQHIWYTAPSGTAGNAITFTQAMTLDASVNLKLGGTADRATTAGTNHLDIFNGTAPVGTLANGISIYSAAGEAYVMDAAGNATLFSPHDAETNEWIFKSKHTPSGKVLKIDVERLLKFVNDHFGLDAVHEFVEE